MERPTSLRCRGGCCSSASKVTRNKDDIVSVRAWGPAARLRMQTPQIGSVCMLSDDLQVKSVHRRVCATKVWRSLKESYRPEGTRSSCKGLCLEATGLHGLSGVHA